MGADSVVATWAVDSEVDVLAVDQQGAYWGGFGGGHMGGSFGRGHFASGGAFGRGFAGQRFAGHFDHDRGFGRHLRFGPGYYDYGCSYGYPYYNRYSCYTSEY